MWWPERLDRPQAICSSSAAIATAVETRMKVALLAVVEWNRRKA